MLGSPLHEHHLLRYTIAEVPNSPHLVLLTFYDEFEKRVLDIEYTRVRFEDLIIQLQQGADLNLEHVYIKNFSLSRYRQILKLDEAAPVVFNTISAKGCFFDSDTGIDFNGAVFNGKKTSFENCIFSNGFVDFSNTVFNSEEISFRKSKFGSGSTSFRSAKFKEGRLNFNHVNFGTGNTVFVDVHFLDCFVEFKGTYFGDGNLDFKFSKFNKGSVSFERASFSKGRKDFKNVEFGRGRVDFRKVQFNDGDVIFEGAEFNSEKISFRGSVFGCGAKKFDQSKAPGSLLLMDQVELGQGTLSFYDSEWGTLQLQSIQFNVLADLRCKHCKSLRLSDSIIRDIMELPSPDFVGMEELDLKGIRILGRLFVTWSKHLKALIYKPGAYSFQIKAEQFRVLKENFRANGQYDDEDAAYLEFRRCIEKQKLAIVSEKGYARVFSKLGYLWRWFIFDQIGRYATNPMRVLSHALGTVIGFAVVYWFTAHFAPFLGKVGSTLPESLNQSSHFLNSLYYSAITFFTVGYGDYFAVGWLKGVAALEGFCGVFLMSYFTVAFVRKILR